MRTTLELLSILQINRFALYDFTYKEKVSLRGLTYKIVNGGHISYFMVIRLTKSSSSLMYNEVFNVLSLTYVNEPNKPWINLTVYSKDDSMFRGILDGYYDIDKMWPRVYSYFKNSTITKAMFIYFCKNELNITDFECS